ncbi:MAG TPA: glycosyltransferase family 4 protein [Patescibacteria group bacterium]|nr:glycosyltransferase family 4 protein [Patescibacteria group bacterium]
MVGRVQDVPAAKENWKRVDGGRISVTSIPDYLGPWQYLQKASQIQQAAINAVGAADAVIFRVPSQLASIIEPLLRSKGHPYAVEVIADPYDVFSPGAFRHPLRPFFRWWFTRQLQQQCHFACAAAYVTSSVLQRRYPCPNLEVGVSDVELVDGWLAPAPRIYREEKRTFTLITVATLAQLYKAPHILIDAVASCISSGLDIKLIIVGDGKHLIELEKRVVNLGLEKRVEFQGQLPTGDAIRVQLDRADVFVLPSYQEGLPRAMIEAMARALPCIGSTVGGIPELLNQEDMIPPGNVAALASKILYVVTLPERMSMMSARNWEKAKEYDYEVLRQQWNKFYGQVRSHTQSWLNG